MKKIVFTIGTFFLIVSTIYSQTITEWSLENCIDYAYTQNITIRKSEVSNQRFEVYAEQAKAQRLPSAGVTVNQNFNWTKRAVTQYTHAPLTQNRLTFKLCF